MTMASETQAAGGGLTKNKKGKKVTLKGTCTERNTVLC